MRSTLRLARMAPLAAALALGCGGSGGAPGGSPANPTILSGPEERVVTDDGHLVVHFTRSGADAAPEQLVEWAREALALGWSELVDRGGWTAPPADDGAGGDDRYDVYLMSFFARGGEQSANGLTFPGATPASSYIYVNTDITPGSDPSKHPEVIFFTENYVRSVFVHELGHAVQLATNPYQGSDMERFLEENVAQYHAVEALELLSSTLPKDVLVIQTLLSQRMGKPELSLHDRDARRDYVPLWSKYIAESRGGDPRLLRRIFETMATGADALTATDAVLQQTGGDLESDFQTYAEWNYRIGEHADGTGYAEAARFATLFGSVRVSGALGPAPAQRKSGGDAPRNLGTNYVRFAPDPATTDGELRFTGQFGVRWAVSVMAFDPELGRYQIERALVGPVHTDAAIRIPSWNQRTDLVAVVSNLTRDLSANSSQAGYKLETRGVSIER
ncbi:MAG: hypothetical protein U0610_16045 [bacterium]